MTASTTNSQSKQTKQIKQFRNDCPGIPLPPEPILTRWGTWINACIYHAENFDSVASIVRTFHPTDAESIKVTQELLRTKATELKKDLAYLKSNFSFIPGAITKFESVVIDLNDGIATYEEIQSKLYELRTPIYHRKFNDVIGRNTNFNRLRIIRNIIYGRREENDFDESDVQFVNNYSPAEISLFKNVPLSSTDLERTFSIYKTVLTERRRSFSFDNLKKYVVICCNARNLQ